jgi:hypothetical protein
MVRGRKTKGMVLLVLFFGVAISSCLIKANGYLISRTEQAVYFSIAIINVSLARGPPNFNSIVSFLSG